MKLLRVGPPGAERPVVLGRDGAAYDLSGRTSDIDGAFLAGLDPAELARAVESGELPVADIAGQRIGAPVVRPGKVVGIGLNYRDHAAEAGAQIPAEPVVFLKPSNTVVGPYDEVLVPRGSEKTDYEVELAIVIGRTARYLESEQEAAAVIAGYATVNDVTERAFQFERGGQWDKGKSAETFTPLGPWLVTADEVADPQRLGLKLWVNGDLRQNGSTAEMIFPVLEIVRYLSQFMVLEPGDVIVTGTPAGVTLGHPGTPFLRPADVVELEVEGLGRQRQVLGKA
ncbi:fumarylacetoacetate hydrolase family protein [Kitasatospora atroaurantiaca]|uniref:2-keto-4-pentenoate hydratase/2-oxohepta-3-ene-1,7-dioic acid hydratase in catechol pathway n=1 Tax=Kitasatospora atroaurantiaca TaxID=285545 RepID=A0A561EV60_9ACTN|nr:fumarylacetoacetate hydrolase family protein [Kitasatospora atroaurantiaca]TWE19488.1 2-keto-4-pentenoate hydratase/2-oxohepta-3-ene-1,7-dioic acid hydratase in catechol pathway [Kitasatospora atroaurantiaca]